MTTCVICDRPLDGPVYESESEISISSLCALVHGRTIVHHCGGCGHLQTTPLLDLDAYYARHYELLTDSEEEDQLVETLDGVLVERSVLQARTILARVEVPPGAMVLDYGCGKAVTLRRLHAQRSDAVPHVFDVSAAYAPFWEQWLDETQWGIRDIPRAWDGRFDLVTALFVLEHVERPLSVLESIRCCLHPGGTLYAIVPAVHLNPADFIVCDHVNHFSTRSLRHLLARAGFDHVEIDDDAHPGAYVVTATRGDRAAAATPQAPPPAEDGDDGMPRARAVALGAAWRDAASVVGRFEETHGGGRRAAIYGAGFYGTFVATSLAHPERLECFVDRNPHLQGRTHLERPIVAPAALDPEIEVVYVGLNPRGARGAIDAVEAWADRDHDYCFLEPLGDEPAAAGAAAPAAAAARPGRARARRKKPACST